MSICQDRQVPDSVKRKTKKSISLGQMCAEADFGLADGKRLCNLEVICKKV